MYAGDTDRMIEQENIHWEYYRCTESSEKKSRIRRDRGKKAAKNRIRQYGSENVSENEIRRDGSENAA